MHQGLSIRRSFRRIFSFLSRCLNMVADLIQDPPEPIYPPDIQRLIPWHEARGDLTLRLDYDLDTDSVVLDVGGYEGQWASDIFAKYRCQLHVYEPVNDFADFIEKRFFKNPRITLHRFGLAGSTREETITLSGDASSTHTRGERTARIQLVDAVEAIGALGVSTIDLVKINIEGGEYELLNHLLVEGLISKMRHIQIQFHDFVPGAEEKMTRIRNHLSETHEPTYQYAFVWESWSLKSQR
jgi:FkbM family methyltransferase